MRPEILIDKLAMHIPDGLLSLPVSIACWLLAALFIGISVYKTRGELGERQVPLMGVMAAFIFAAQMINFAVIGGTSGHLLGGALAAVALGPWPAVLVMSAVVIVQGLLFQDGGLLVMGANLLNMAVVAVVAGYGFYRIFANRPRTTRLIGVFTAAWLSVMAAALGTSLQLWLSGTVNLGIVVPAMMGVHALIAIGEALITTAAVSFILRVRPDIIEPSAGKAHGGRGWIAAGLIIILATVLLTPLASVDPDGLNRVAMDLGFIEKKAASPLTVLGGYSIPFLGDTPLSTILAAALGVIVVGGVVILLAAVRRKSAKGER